MYRDTGTDISTIDRRFLADDYVRTGTVDIMTIGEILHKPTKWS